jgi:hypothetical protein
MLRVDPRRARHGRRDLITLPALTQDAESQWISCGVALLFEVTTLQRIAERAENIAWHAEEML